MNILALDLSLTASGWADPAGSGVLSPPSSVGRGMSRLAWIRDQVLELADGADLAVLEGYSFGSRGRQHATGECGGVVRLSLYEAGVPVAEVSPASLKKFATGKGNAPKDQVLAAAIRRLGYTGHDNNEADALWLLQAALHQYGLPARVQLPKTHLAALGAVKWPAVDLHPDLPPGPGDLFGAVT